MDEEEFHLYNQEREISIGYMVFDGFAPLDVFGPLQFISGISADFNMSLSIISKKAGPISTYVPLHNIDDGMPMKETISASVIATHSVNDAPSLNLLIVPGGIGNRARFMGNDTWIENFVASRFNATDFVASVCTGAMSLAKAGVLDGKRATTNKLAWSQVIPFGNNVTWVPNARWTHDDKIWTSSGVAAGMDMTYALLRWLYGDERVNVTMNAVEYAPHVDPHWDPFSVVHNVPGADHAHSLKDLVGPVGYDN